MWSPAAAGSVWLEVEDHGSLWPKVGDGAADAPNGRGLRIVGSLAAAWGCDPNPRGKTVWTTFSVT